MKPKYLFLGGLAAVVAYLLFWPVSIQPASWTPPPAPSVSEGPYQANDRLASMQLVSTAPFGAGPETVVADAEGRIYCGLDNGIILRYDHTGALPVVFARTGGRPLGLAFDASGALLAADGEKGLLSISPEGVVTVLASQHEGTPFGFADDLDQDHRGLIYFSDASRRFGVGKFKDDLFEHRPNGALYAFDPQNSQTRLIADSMYFANGVSISPDSNWLLVVETSKYRILKIGIREPCLGKREVFADNLPGFPDGVACDAEGICWTAVGNPRNPTLDALLPYPFLRAVVKRLPEAVQPKETRYSMVLGFDSNGKLVHNLQDPGGKLALISAVARSGNHLLLGSLKDSAFGIFPAPPYP